MSSFSPIKSKSLLPRQIPTIFGLLILIVALGAGVLFFNEGFKGFAPRAAPETTPKNVKISNVTDTGFTVSFLTDEPTSGFIKYGNSPSDLTSQAGDERDQLSGSVADYTLHYITVRGLSPTTQYYFTLGTGGTPEYQEGDQPFTTTTSVPNTDSGTSQTIYGNVVNAAGAPAEGSVVFVKSPESGELSALVKSSGSWAIPLVAARSVDGSSPVTVTDDTLLDITAQGLTPELTAQTQVTVLNAQPVPTLTLGGQGTSQISDATLQAADVNETLPAFDEELLTTASDSGNLEDLDLLDESTELDSSDLESQVVDLTDTAPQVVETTQPVIVGEAPPNVTVTIQINSETQINHQVTSEADGSFAVDVASLQQNLEPGEHSVTYSYVDPTTGQTVTKTQSFTVAAPNGATDSDTSSQLAQATLPTPTPFGSGNPFPASTPTPTPFFTPSPTPLTASGSGISSGSATRSATGSGRTSQPATGSGIPVSGSISATLALIGGGIFFVLAGAWSFWVAQHLSASRETE